MEWLKLLVEVLLGLGILGTIFKWIFSSRFRVELKKKNFEKDKQEVDAYLEMCNKFKENENGIHPIQFQYSTNNFLGSSRFHYSLFKDKVKNSWNFKKVFSDLNYGYLYLRQVVDNNNAHLEYILKENTIKKIEMVSIVICALAALLYIFLVVFELFFLESIILNHGISKDDYTQYKLLSFVIYVVLILGASIFGSKASTALSLKNTFDIKEKT